MRNVDTFFRGRRRESFIEGAAILCNAAGEKRLKLSMKIPLTGDQLIGMPSWVAQPFSDIAKPEYAVEMVKSGMELDPMICRVYALPDDEEEAITFDGVRMCSFKIEREKDNDSEHPDIALTFTAYLPRTGRFLQFADENFATSLFILYEAAQPSLLDNNPNVKAEEMPTLALKANAKDDDEEEDVDDEDDEDDEGNENESSKDEEEDDEDSQAQKVVARGKAVASAASGKPVVIPQKKAARSGKQLVQ
jgi:hypothetical protein